MNYVIVGAGGCGGSIAAYLARAGKDVTVIARGKHLEKMQKDGIKMETPHLGDFTVPVHAMAADDYEGIADVIFVCVKGYSVMDIVPFLQAHSDAHTVIIPILNIYGTGSKLQTLLPEPTVLDGCIYIAAEIKEPGVIPRKEQHLPVLYTAQEKSRSRSRKCLTLPRICDRAGFEAVISENIGRDAFQKYGGCGTRWQPADSIMMPRLTYSSRLVKNGSFS